MAKVAVREKALCMKHAEEMDVDREEWIPFEDLDVPPKIRAALEKINSVMKTLTPFEKLEGVKAKISQLQEFQNSLVPLLAAFERDTKAVPVTLGVFYERVKGQDNKEKEPQI